MHLILSRQDVMTCMRASKGYLIIPRLTADGRSAVSTNVVGKSSYSDLDSVFLRSSIETVADWCSSLEAVTTLDNKPVYLSNVKKQYAVSEVQPNIFRFEVHENDYATSNDLKNGNRRSEIVPLKTNGWASGDTLWMAFSVVRGPSPTMMLTDVPSRFGYCMQIHSGVSGMPPVCVLNYAQGLLRVFTMSDASPGQFMVRHSQAIPEVGVIKNFVFAATLGESGHLSAWIDGVLSIDLDCPIGFYLSQSGSLGHPQYGFYTKNWNTVDTVYLANIEWGSESLLGRVLSPTPVANLSPWA